MCRFVEGAAQKKKAEGQKHQRKRPEGFMCKSSQLKAAWSLCRNRRGHAQLIG